MSDRQTATARHSRCWCRPGFLVFQFVQLALGYGSQQISINCKFLLLSATDIATATASVVVVVAAALITSLQFYGASKLMLNGFSRLATFRTRRNCSHQLFNYICVPASSWPMCHTMNLIFILIPMWILPLICQQTISLPKATSCATVACALHLINQEFIDDDSIKILYTKLYILEQAGSWRQCRRQRRCSHKDIIYEIKYMYILSNT